MKRKHRQAGASKRSRARRARPPRLMSRVGVLVSGRGSNLKSILDAGLRGRMAADVVVVISDRPDAPALRLARRHGCETLVMDPHAYMTRERFDEAVADELRRFRVDLVVLAGYMRIVTPALIEPFRHRIMNIHPSLVPSFPGLKAQWQAKEYGVKVAGCTVHFVTEEVDGGPVIIQAAIAVQPGERETTLATRILEQEHRILPRAIELFAQGRLRVNGRQVTVAGLRKNHPSALVHPPLSG
jgi:phosphoribosylglycinamide formyltransferase 1